jgi:P27 family predicted phage terminase small subunit
MSSPRKSEEWHKLAGSEKDARRDRSKSAGDATTQGGRPRMPKTVKADPVACAAFRNAVRLLRARRTLSPGDAPTLEVYAQVYSRWQLALADIRARGMEIAVEQVFKGGSTTTMKPNPSVAVAEKAESRLLALTKSLGLTPADREKVKKVKPTEAEQIAKPGSALAQFPEMFGRKTKQPEVMNESEPDDDTDEQN